MSPVSRPAPERFWEKVNKTDGCWMWVGAISDTGYGSFNAGGGLYTGSHRFAYQQVKGAIPAGLYLDHICRVRSCVNPDHLEPVTNEENIRRGNGGINNASKTHCPKGHEYTPENTVLRKYPNGRTGRICRSCLTKGLRERRLATACKWGHEFRDGSFWIDPAGRRQCIPCRRNHDNGEEDSG